jgi:hypothetical protein
MAIGEVVMVKLLQGVVSVLAFYLCCAAIVVTIMRVMDGLMQWWFR